MAFAAPVVALAASLRNEGQAFNVLFRFIVTPMFLFSGTFYPISQLPGWGAVARLRLAAVARHRTRPRRRDRRAARARRCSGTSRTSSVWLVVGVALARWRFRVRLEE